MLADEISTERRVRERDRQVSGQLQLQFAKGDGSHQSLPVEVFDSGGGGIGIVSDTILALNLEVLLIGDWGTGVQRQRASVAWCRQTQSGRFRTGLLFLDNAPTAEKPVSEKAAKEKPTEEKPFWKKPIEEAKPSDANETDWEAVEDHYEQLQLHMKADQETIQRVYRLMAQRFHPDNKESGNAERFRVITDAYRVLSDPEQRAAYDIATQLHRTRRWKIFDQSAASNALGDEKRKRAGVLGALYTKRLNEPESAVLSIQDLEELLGVPREHLEFALWYLKGQGQIVRTDSGKYSITIKGVDAAEESQTVWRPPPSKLLEAPELAAAG